MNLNESSIPDIPSEVKIQDQDQEFDDYLNSDSDEIDDFNRNICKCFIISGVFACFLLLLTALFFYSGSVLENNGNKYRFKAKQLIENRKYINKEFFSLIDRIYNFTKEDGDEISDYNYNSIEKTDVIGREEFHSLFEKMKKYEINYNNDVYYKIKEELWEYKKAAEFIYNKTGMINFTLLDQIYYSQNKSKINTS